MPQETVSCGFNFMAKQSAQHLLARGAPWSGSLPTTTFTVILDHGVQFLRMSCSNIEARSSVSESKISVSVQVRSQLSQHLHCPVLTGSG